MNKSGLVSYEDRYLHTIVECANCHTILFQGCSLGLTVSDIKECPKCKNPIDVTQKWGAKRKR